jgi:hypothetical protein
VRRLCVRQAAPHKVRSAAASRFSFFGEKRLTRSESVGMDSAGMTVYSIDQASGELKPIGHYPMGTQPNWIEIVDLK